MTHTAKKTINAIIIDDEESFVSSLSILVKMNFDNIEIVGVANNVKNAIQLIKQSEPDIVFLDINLPDGDGFDVLENTNRDSFKTVFTTSMTGYAIKAFEFAALHYILKPVKLEDLQSAVNRYEDINFNKNLDSRLQLLKNVKERGKPEKIFLPLGEGLTLVQIPNIMRCQADDNCVFVFLNNGEKLHVSRSLQTLNKLLIDLDFLRIHNKHLVNLNYIKQYKGGKSPYIVLSDDTELPISQTYKSDVTSILKSYALSL
jgi:two-component system LytT family response regulator